MVPAESASTVLAYSGLSKTPLFISIPRPTLRFREIHFLALTLCSFQILDGLLTAIGVRQYGSAIEANLLLRWAMEGLGQFNALLMFKLTAIFFVFALCRLASQILWIKPAMRFLVFVYFFGAIVPWGYLLIPRVV